MTARRCLTWAFVVSLFALSGASLGHLLDRLFWEFSFDYIYSSRQFLVVASKLGLFFGTITAATATVGSAPRAGARILLGGWLVTVALVIVLASLGGAAGAGSAKWLLGPPASESLAPRTRIWFCDSVWIGALTGALVGVSGANVRIFRARGASLSPRPTLKRDISGSSD